MDAPLPPVSRLTSHQAPALLIAAVAEVSADHGRVHLLPHQGLDAWQLLEACAQAVAVLAGARRLLAAAPAPGSVRGEVVAGPEQGRLVAAKEFVVARAARAGEAVVVETRPGVRLGVLMQHAVRAFSGDEVLAAGELTIAAGAMTGTDGNPQP